MEENDDFPSEEEFSKMMQSLPEDEQIAIMRRLADFVKENRDICEFTDEQIAESDAKLERYEKAVETKKQVYELKHRFETELKIVEDRINARFADMAETESPDFFDTTKNNKSH